MQRTIKVFVDSSVLFAAIYSKQGYARDLLRLAANGEVNLVISQDVLEETERNLGRKIPEQLDNFKQLLLIVGIEVVASPSKEQVTVVEEYVVAKDAMIVAAAINTQPEYFVTYDRKHLLGPAVVATRSKLRIVTPEVVVNYILHSNR